MRPTSAYNFCHGLAVPRKLVQKPLYDTTGQRSVKLVDAGLSFFSFVFFHFSIFPVFFFFSCLSSPHSFSVTNNNNKKGICINAPIPPLLNRTPKPREAAQRSRPHVIFVFDARPTVSCALYFIIHCHTVYYNHAKKKQTQNAQLWQL